ncbi:hypothetical protein KBY97_12270 [Synechococcus sp. ATX 2A4]|uniref:hypothetical protein n=1 Tax=Synechococcus sp. ATX 2A4 TaxID=2823727 RepID=UPI0020CE0905|nr:hypothetical protein [Synechococcus sp. ATX 2A4]MCP9885889.1 hypothetical protein [Synechococcus sp. ATX 2A4]
MPCISHLIAVSGSASGAVAAGGDKEPWILRKTRDMEHLRSVALGARHVSGSWTRFNAGLDDTVWVLQQIHHTLNQRLRRGAIWNG